MCVKQQRALRAGHQKLGEHQGVSVGFEDLGGKPAPAQHIAEHAGISPDIGAVGRDVGDGEQLHQFAHDLLLVGGDERLDGPSQLT